MNAGNKNTQHAPSMKMEYDYLYGWTINGHIRKNLKNGEPWESRRSSTLDYQIVEFSIIYNLNQIWAKSECVPAVKVLLCSQ